MATYWENSCSFGLRYVFMVLVPDCFWSGNLFLIVPFPDLCLLVPIDHLRLSFIAVKTMSVCKIVQNTNMHLFLETVRACA